MVSHKKDVPKVKTGCRQRNIRKLMCGRREHIELPCDYCYQLFPCSLLQTHMSLCRRASARTQEQRLVKQSRRRAQSLESKTRRNGEEPTAGANVAGAATGITQPTLLLDEGTLREWSTDSRRGAFCTAYDFEETVSEAESGPNDSDGNNNGNSGSGSSSSNNNSNNTGENNDNTDINGVSQGVLLKKYIPNISATGSDERSACCVCQRKFSPDRISVHQEICQRVKKRADDRRKKRHDKHRELCVSQKDTRSRDSVFRYQGTKTAVFSLGRRRKGSWWRAVRATSLPAKMRLMNMGDVGERQMSSALGHEQQRILPSHSAHAAHHVGFQNYRDLDPPTMSMSLSSESSLGGILGASRDQSYHSQSSRLTTVSPHQKQESVELQPTRTQRTRSRPASAFAVTGSRGHAGRGSFPCGSEREASSFSPVRVVARGTSRVTARAASCSSSPAPPRRADRVGCGDGRRGGNRGVLPSDTINFHRTLLGRTDRGDGKGFRESSREDAGDSVEISRSYPSKSSSALMFFSPSWGAGRRKRLL